MSLANHTREISEKVKIDILMHEYETLRSEILHRINRRFAFLGLTGTIVAYAFFKIDSYTFVNVSVIIMSILILGLVWFQFGRLIQQCSSRISEIEQKINSIVGDELLVWETRGKNKFFNCFHH